MDSRWIGLDRGSNLVDGPRTTVGAPKNTQHEGTTNKNSIIDTHRQESIHHASSWRTHTHTRGAIVVATPTGTDRPNSFSGQRARPFLKFYLWELFIWPNPIPFAGYCILELF
jgi:hypothetical protein